MAKNPTNSAPHLSSSLLSKTYFASPIRTLSESITDDGQCCIFTHDLVEAYNVLSARIRFLMTQALSTDELLPCLTAFRNDASQIIQCISRDLQRLLPSPFDSAPVEYSYAGQSYCIEVPNDVDDIQTMTDSILLCQYALRFASDLFTFPMLYSNISENLLISLLYDVLSLCTTTHPPIPNMDKTRDTVLWMLKIQQLPISVLHPAKDIIVTVLRNFVSDKIGCATARVTALKAIYYISKQHPTLVDSFIDLLPTVLELLNAESSNLRLNAALALCGFAVAKLKSENGGSYPRSQATEMARMYLDRQTTRRRESSSQHGPLLPDILQSALTNEDFWQKHGPSFALAVVSSFLVLLDHFLWTCPRPLRLLVKTIAQIIGQKQSNIRNTHPELWRILIWAFSRLPTQAGPDDSQGDVESLRSTRESAYQIVLQERRSGLALGIIDALLYPDGGRSSADVKKVLDVTLDLLVSDKLSSREDGIKILERLLANIGSSSPVQPHRVSLDIPFSWTLVDGSLLSQKACQLRVSRVEFDFQRLSPLSGEEILAYWDDLSQAWIKAAQRYLDSDQSISGLFGVWQSLLRVWQALLLVRGDSAGSPQHFTASSSFATTVSDILNTFSIPLRTPDQQIRYITFLSKLWGVLQNVFAREWLSSPAETSLGRFLEKSFDLSDDNVKSVWYQLCRDLISVGIPALLHIFHVRSINRSGLDVTRELWLMVAAGDVLIGDEAAWVDLLRFLTIPIGIWDMSPTELEAWEQVLNKAFELGVQARQPRMVLISCFFEALTERLDLLKGNSRMLYNLLSRSLPASVSEVEPRLLRLVNEHLHISYNDTNRDEGEHESALQLLRLIGEVVSKTDAAEIVSLLCTMQKSLSCWITDEREVLANPLHDEVVALLYKRPLELLSKLEPSIAVLTNLADFIQSVFLHIRGDGVFAFQLFWRSTYHIRKDIPKNIYPVQITACLQAWSDFCEDSFADDIPSDSGSQSLDTSSVPNSQLAQSMSFGPQSYPEDYGAMFDPEVNTAEASYRITPTPRNQVLPSSDDMSIISVPAKEDSVRQSRGSRYEASHSQSMGQQSQNLASTLKRSAEFETPPSKRPRLDIPRINFKPRAGKERAQEPSLSHTSNASMLLSSMSEPLSRTSSPIPPPSASRPSQSRNRFEKGSMTSWIGSGHRDTAIPDDDAPIIRPLAKSPVVSDSEDDYDSWERGVSVAVLRAVQAERGNNSEFLVPDSPDNPHVEVENDDTEAASEQCDSDEDILSPSLGQYPIRSRPRYRSQTAPELDGSSSNPLPHAQPLRRHQTSPGPPKKTLSIQLDALRNAYAALTDTTGISQVDVEEILQARRLANQINQVLDEQICSKVVANSSRPRTPET